MNLEIRSGWTGADQAAALSGVVLPNQQLGRRIMRDPRERERLLTAWIGGRVVGYVAIEIHDGTTCLHEIGVNPSYQGRGIGRTLAHAIALDATTNDLWLQPITGREALFEAWGFDRPGDGGMYGARAIVIERTAP